MRTLRIVQDTREQLPLSFPTLIEVGGKKYKVEVVVDGLPTGDYSLEGFGGRPGEEFGICIERKKSFGELVQNLGHNRDRFTREIMRMALYERAIIVVEQSAEELATWDYRGGMTPDVLRSSLLGLCEQFRVVPVFCDGRQETEKYVLDALRRFSGRPAIGTEPVREGDVRDEPARLTKRMVAAMLLEMGELRGMVRELVTGESEDGR